MNESLLSTQLATWKAVKGGDTPVETLDQQLTALQDQLSVLQSRYTADHPDVIKTKNQIEQLKRRMSEGPKSGGTPANAQATGIEPPAGPHLRPPIPPNHFHIPPPPKRPHQIY